MQKANNSLKSQAFNSHLQQDQQTALNITNLKVLPAREEVIGDFPEYLSGDVKTYCRQKGIQGLYSHQQQGLQLLREGKNIVVTTGTASGKSLIYQLAISNCILESKDNSALLLFPTKALTNNQLSDLEELFTKIGIENKKFAAVYDGDTPGSQRTAIRNQVHCLLTNPDMLHVSLLPHHTSWKRFFQNLQYVVIDEAHIYKGVFGSHFANVMRRLKRILNFYNADPQFICTSATMRDPRQFMQRLLEEDFDHVSEQSNPQGKKQLYFYNPPLINEQLGIRRGVVEEGIQLTKKALDIGVQTLVFVRARKTVEIFLKKAADGHQLKDLHGYRSGYLPAQRRAIEQGLLTGDIRAVVATNALELGMDIGGIDAVFLLGYPGSIASFIQQVGRAGRKGNDSTAVFLGTMDPIDQFIVKNPAYILENSPEQALINPDNLLIVFNHLRSAAFELPFQRGDAFGSIQGEMVEKFLEILSSQGVLVERNAQYYWIADSYPAGDISIRSISSTPYSLMLIEGEKTRRIGEVDGKSAFWMVHPGAIYLQEGESYLVEDLDLNDHKAYLRKGEFNYFTNPKREMDIHITEVINSNSTDQANFHFGEVNVLSKVVGFDEISWDSYEVIQTKELTLPEEELSTQAFWITFSDQTIQTLREKDLWLSDSNDYGSSWEAIRKSILSRDGNRCSLCGKTAVDGQLLHVHHRKPFRLFPDKEIANHASNLVTLCQSCHRRVEQSVRIKSGLSGLGYIFSHLAPLFLMCDQRDLNIFVEARWTEIENRPVVMLFDSFPGGIGLSESIYEQYARILQESKGVIETCACEWGCPSCVGPVNEEFFDPKKASLALIEGILQG